MMVFPEMILQAPDPPAGAPETVEGVSAGDPRPQSVHGLGFDEHPFGFTDLLSNEKFDLTQGLEYFYRTMGIPFGSLFGDKIH